MAPSNIDRRGFLLRSAALGLGAAALSGSSCAHGPGESGRPPNFVILFADDMGYGDWEYGGHPTIRTPHLSRMAREGARFTQFYAGGPSCSPSRACLLTGRSTARNGIIRVLLSRDRVGLPKSEITLPGLLKPLGYATACIGKWHLGHTPEHHPDSYGFDRFYGLLYSNDMQPSELYDGESVIEAPVAQETLTARYTREALDFIEANRKQPFLLYLPYTFPHVPLHASEDFHGRSRAGLYGDVIAEIDWSVGQINDKLDALGLSENTLVVFTSDNGPWTIMKQDGGTTGLLRGGKGDTWEGGMRVPFAARWPGRIPAGTVSPEVASVLDFLPTMLRLAGGEIPGDRPVDGIDMLPALEGGSLPERTVHYHRGERLCALRRGKWKIHFRYFEPGQRNDFLADNWTPAEPPLLFDLETDPSERFDLAAERPEVVERLAREAADYKAELESRGENRALIAFLRESYLDPKIEPPPGLL